MLSWPATGTTDISVTTGASFELIFDMTSSLSRKPRACGRVAADTRQDSKPATCSRIALLSRHEPVTRVDRTVRVFSRTAASCVSSGSLIRMAAVVEDRSSKLCFFLAASYRREYCFHRPDNDVRLS